MNIKKSAKAGKREAAEARREDAKEMILDAGIYSGEAVKLAAFVFSGRADIRIVPGKGVLKVSLKAGFRSERDRTGQDSSSLVPLSGNENAWRAAGEFLNEVLNQQCRIDLAKKNSKIAGIIVTKALLSAAGKK